MSLCGRYDVIIREISSEKRKEEVGVEGCLSAE
jgi:hypothetical protein